MLRYRLALTVLFTAVALLPTPAVAATVAGTETVRVSAPAGTKININTAGVDELMTLAGVGRSLAEKIVKHRDQHGLFKKPEDLRKVDGVGSSLLQNNRARIVVK